MPNKPGRPLQAKTAKEFFASPRAKELWKKGKENAETSPSYTQYDDGVYRAKVVSAIVEQAKASGIWRHNVGFQFLEGPYKGKVVHQYQGIENDIGMGIVIQDMEKLGHKTNDGEDVIVADKKIVGVIADIQIKTNGDYKNVKVLRKVEGGDVEVADDEEADEKIIENRGVEEEDGEDDSDSDDNDNDDDDEDAEEDEEKPKAKKSSVVETKKPTADTEDEEEEDSDEEDEDEEKVTLVAGMKLKINYDDEEVKVKFIKEVNEKKGLIKVKLPSGDKVVINVADIVDVIS